MAKISSKQINYNARIYTLIGVVIVALILSSMRILQFQIVDGEKHVDLAQKTAYTNIPIKAARGQIVDRKGVVLATNKAVFSLVLDYSFLKKGSENEIIYKLIKLLENNDETWIDNLPIATTSPYDFLPDSDKDIKRLKTKLRLNDYATSENCLDKLIRENNIEGYTPEYTRKIAGVRYEMIQKDFSRYNRYTFAQDIKPQTVAIIRELSDELQGATVVEEAIRSYVSGDVASHLIGGVGPIYAEEKDQYLSNNYKMSDIVGKEGIEKAYENELRGKDGIMSVTHSPKGKVLSIEQTREPVPGNTVMLSLDYAFQKQIQTILADHITWYNQTKKPKYPATAGAIVVTDVKTGELLASVSYPYYDINATQSQIKEIPNSPLFSRDIKAKYRPGSTFKTSMAVAGLSENIITPNSLYNCTATYKIGTSSFGCLMHGHRQGPLNIFTALQHSCNIYFYELSRALGIEKMNEYASLLGLDQDTGLEIPNSTGVLSSREQKEKRGEQWYPGDVVQASIGQLDTYVTPLQMAIQAATIANKGVRYNAKLGHSILSYDQKEVIRNIEPKIASEFTISQQVYDTVTQGMILAGQTINGANNLRDLGYDVAVKTGTPQTGTNRFNNAFIAFAPVAEPEIAISCLVEDGLNTNLMIKQILLAYEESKKPPQETEPDPQPETDTIPEQ